MNLEIKLLQKQDGCTQRRKGGKFESVEAAHREGRVERNLEGKLDERHSLNVSSSFAR